MAILCLPPSFALFKSGKRWYEQNVIKYLYVAILWILMWVFWGIDTPIPDIPIIIGATIGGGIPFLFAAIVNKMSDHRDYIVFTVITGTLTWGTIIWAACASGENDDHSGYVGYMIVAMILGGAQNFALMAQLEAKLNDTPLAKFNAGSTVETPRKQTSNKSTEGEFISQ